MAGNTETRLAARASYKKQDGYLYLTEYPHRVVWVNGKTGAVPIQLLTTDCTNLYANKLGVKPPKLRVVSNDQEFNFVFTAEEPMCTLNRDSFRDQVKSLIREGMAQPGSADVGDVTMDMGTPDAGTPTSENEELPPDSPPPALNVPAIDPVKELAARMFRLKKKVLLRDPELAALHRAVVIKGKLSETDFWSTRQHLIDEAAIADSQKKGKSSRLVDPKPALSTTGDMKVIMTPQLALDIFEEWPVVARAFRENVSSKMSEAEFWKRYFESRLYHNHKASVRSSAAQHIIKEDVIFDQYLEPVDDDVEPRHARKDAVNVLVDLVATREDHGQTGNTLDMTMQPGKQKSSLATNTQIQRAFRTTTQLCLVREICCVSFYVSNHIRGQVRPVKRARLDHANDESLFEEIDMEDLHAGDNRAGIALDMKNRQRYFEGRSGTNEGSTNVDFKTALTGMNSQLGGWNEALRSVRQDSQTGVNAVKSISQNIYARTKVKSTKLDVSPEFYKQMRSLEASANEYLRHFWFLILPPPEGVERLSGEERGKKVGLMRDELLMVQKRGPELVHVAATNRWDSAGVEEALKPMMGAIDKALGFVAGRGG